MVRLFERVGFSLLLVLLLSTGCKHGGQPRSPSFETPATSAAPTRKPATTPLGKLNEHFHTDYDRVLAAHVEQLKAAPLVWMRGSQLILRHQGVERKHTVAGDTYHAVKSISHAPFLLVITLLGNEGPTLTETTRASLVRQRQLVTDALAALTSEVPEQRPRVPAELVPQEQALLKTTGDFIEEVLASGPPSRERLESFAAGVRPTLHTNFRAAAHELLGNLHQRVTEFRAELGEAEWARVHVVVSVARQARAREISVQYFERVLGERMGEGASSEGRLVVTEDFNRGQTLELLAAHVLDQEAGAILLGDPKRLQMDALAEAAAELLPRLLPDRS
ncbi:hypothetical protein JQX13_50130 [Archangium violaceum]|uniref:hypothetical protein n=1 Tax=Archangium violaceum TaxID=83451 RepID=UPI00193C73E5|nr:hypothetical protein [Archangium violaceum]QRK08033.1 hypothetical protein JQX13_50130 [Archangium violaceum]